MMLEPCDFEFNEKRFQIGVLEIPQAWRVSKRILAALDEISERRQARQTDELTPDEERATETPPAEADPETRKLAMMVFSRQALIAMDDAASETIMTTCLKVVRRYDDAANGAPRPVLVSGAGLRLRDGDIGLNDMLVLVLQVIEHNCGNFLFGTGTA